MCINNRPWHSSKGGKDPKEELHRLVDFEYASSQALSERGVTHVDVDEDIAD